MMVKRNVEQTSNSLHNTTHLTKKVQNNLATMTKTNTDIFKLLKIKSAYSYNTRKVDYCKKKIRK